jgi:hypothetical protein
MLVVEFRKTSNKENRPIFNAVRDHIIPHLTGKYYAFYMWESLCNLYQIPNQNRNIVLQEKVMGIQILKSYLATSYLGIFNHIRDELAAIKDIVDPKFMVRRTLNNFSKHWGSFVRGIIAR